MDLVWHDPEWEEFQCEGCFAPAFRKITSKGHKRYCTPLCQATAGNRRHRANKQKERVGK